MLRSPVTPPFCANHPEITRRKSLSLGGLGHYSRARKFSADGAVPTAIAADEPRVMNFSRFQIRDDRSSDLRHLR